MKKEFKLRGQLKKFMRWPVFLSVLLIGMDIGVYFLNVKAGVLVTVIVVLYIAIAAALYFYNKPIILNELIDFANQYDQLEQRMLENLAVPYGLVNSEGKLLWGNRNLMEMLGKDKVKKSVSYLFPEITEDNLPQGKKRAEIEIAYEERIYNAVMHQISLEELVNKTGFLEAVGEKPFIYAMYLFDVTELSTYKKKSEEDKLVIAEAYLDNYDEALESVEEVRRALLIALIDRKITKYFSNYGGLVRKLEKDKYFLIMQMSSLRKLQEERFHILDEVKTVNIGNEMSLTLSIGIGVNGATYGQSYEYSRVALAEAVFGDENLMIRVDMSEFMEKHSVSKLVGAPPGYVGYDEAGQLTEKIRRKPYSVVLFDEIEKAHPDVFNMMLQILEDGRLTDSKGRTVDFRNTIIIMTSNVGATEIKKQHKLGFEDGGDEGRYRDMKETLTEALKQQFKPEFLNRVDDIIVFHHLKKEDIGKIAGILLDNLNQRLKEREISLKLTDGALNYLIEKGYDEEYGARPLRRVIQRQLEDRLSEELLKGEIKYGQTVTVDCAGEELSFRPAVRTN